MPSCKTVRIDEPFTLCTFTPELLDVCQKSRRVKQFASLREVLVFALHLVCFAVAAISRLLHPQVGYLGGLDTWFVPLCRLFLKEGLTHSVSCVDLADHTVLRCFAGHTQGNILGHAPLTQFRCNYAFIRVACVTKLPFPTAPPHPEPWLMRAACRRWRRGRW
jgi:hypothetical protein